MQELVLVFDGSKGPALVLMQYTDGSDNSHQGDPIKLVFNVEDPLAVARPSRPPGSRCRCRRAPRPAWAAPWWASCATPTGT